MPASRALFLLDLLCALLIWPLLINVACWGNECTRPTPDGLGVVLYPLANALALYALGLYRRESVIDTRESLARVPLAVSVGAISTAVALWLLGFWIGQPFNRVRLLAAAFLGFGLAGVVARIIFYALKRQNLFQRRLLIVGAGSRAWDLVCLLRNEGSMPSYALAFVHGPGMGEIDTRLREEFGSHITLSEDGDILPSARAQDPDQIVVAPDERRGMRLDSLLECKKDGYPIIQYLTFLEREIRRVDVRRLEIGWLLYSPGFYFGTIDAVLKRVLDFTASLVLLVLFAPFLAAAAIAIKLDDGGPVFYSQQRVTKGGRLFNILKLRTMGTDAEAGGAVWASERDPRVTRVGSFLRTTRIDEMPQLINVLRGDMSLVGPRPERPQFVAELARHLPLYNERHMVKAGLTGWAQINYPYGASIEDARSKLSYDLYYVKNFSILFDVLILLQTLRVVLTGSGAR